MSEMRQYVGGEGENWTAIGKECDILVVVNQLIAVSSWLTTSISYSENDRLDAVAENCTSQRN